MKQLTTVLLVAIVNVNRKSCMIQSRLSGLPINYEEIRMLLNLYQGAGLYLKDADTHKCGCGATD